MRAMDHGPRICSYEDSTYRTDFWEGQGREYEDLADGSHSGVCCRHRAAA
jgi:hypothetical protein